MLAARGARLVPVPVPFAGAARRAALSTRASAISIANIETRWGKLPEAEQGAIADRIAVAEKGDWKNMSLEEKRAAYYIAYGAHGARNPKDPNLTKAVMAWSSVFFALSVGMYFYWETQKPVIRTMTPEWKAAEDARAIELKQNPFSGAYAAERKKNGDN
ncbi:Cytochrome c oxidase subunit 5A [Entophlyctis luteolus]|nr:Cytochrome c oxidase subunit 5A [Entophlyctis luteolus]